MCMCVCVISVLLGRTVYGKKLEIAGSTEHVLFLNSQFFFQSSILSMMDHVKFIKEMKIQFQIHSFVITSEINILSHVGSHL